MSRRVVLAAALVLALAVAAHAHWDESMPSKWVQMPDLDTTGMDVNCTFEEPYQYILADDFLCTETSLVDEIHIWGSWWQDILPNDDPYAVGFSLSIHADIPAEESPTGYSMPGELLWVYEFAPGAFTVQMWAENLQEGWYDPGQNYDPMGDTICWQYNFTINEADAFLQQGTEENPIVYWLDVQAYPTALGSFFGWKTSLDHWNDDAVVGIGMEPNVPFWEELIYPEDHPMYPDSVDLAFVIGDDPDDLDWGDAPEPTYPTTSGMNGASHGIVPTLRLGQLIDAEPDGQPEPMALGDDYNNLADEDGIVQASPLFPGGTAQFMVNLTNSIGGVLDGWIDWDQNGTWDLPAETVFAGQGVPGGVQSVFAIPVPASAVPGPTFGRFRLSSTGVAGPTGFAPDGEVEDYELIVEMESEKWWQSPDLTNTGIDVNCTEPFILADDFLCEEPGRLTEFMVWASWEDDYLPFETDAYAVDFTLSIHEDVPADTAAGIDYSRPGEVLWVYNVPAGDFSAGIWLDMISEGWMDPPEDWRFPGDTECWLYTFSIPPGEAFHQVGMPDSAIVYWLDIQARPHDPQAFWGWKTSIDHWNDDAVWGTGAEPYAGPWGELVYPPLHDLAGQSIDLAFALGMWYGTEVPDGTEPRAFGLRQNTPNPFNPKTTIRYEVPAGGGHVEVQIIDVAGRLVRAYANEHESGGVKSLEWDGRDSEGRQVATGVYFYRLVARGIDESRKMLLLK